MTYDEKKAEVKQKIVALFEEFGGLASNGYDDPDPAGFAGEIDKLYMELWNWYLQHSGREY